LSRGFIGIAALQNVLAGFGLMVAGAPSASVIMQIVPSIVIDPCRYLELDEMQDNDGIAFYGLYAASKCTGQHS
jgi:hypothetical protein